LVFPKAGSISGHRLQLSVSHRGNRRIEGLNSTGELPEQPICEPLPGFQGSAGRMRSRSGLSPKQGQDRSGLAWIC